MAETLHGELNPTDATPLALREVLVLDGLGYDIQGYSDKVILEKLRALDQLDGANPEHAVTGYTIGGKVALKIGFSEVAYNLVAKTRNVKGSVSPHFRYNAAVTALGIVDRNRKITSLDEAKKWYHQAKYYLDEMIDSGQFAQGVIQACLRDLEYAQAMLEKPEPKRRIFRGLGHISTHNAA